MKVVYARERLPKSIFLVGPTPRSPDVKSWRPRALDIIDSLAFEGTVYVPEDSNWSPKFTYDDQVHWEWEGIATATVVLVWVPRELVDMPAFTSNIEYGYTIKDLNLAIGWPPNAPKNRYLEMLAKRHRLPVFDTLEETCEQAVHMTEFLYE